MRSKILILNYPSPQLDRSERYRDQSCLRFNETTLFHCLTSSRFLRGKKSKSDQRKLQKISVAARQLLYIYCITLSGLSLKFQVAGLIIQVGGKSGNKGFCLVVFFFYCRTCCTIFWLEYSICELPRQRCERAGIFSTFFLYFISRIARTPSLLFIIIKTDKSP